MPILPSVGRKSARVRAVIIGIYTVLTLGGITMVYPFLITVTCSVSNVYDYDKYHVFPKYLFDRDERYLKYIAEKYHAILQGFTHPFSLFASCYDAPEHWATFRDMSFEDGVIDRYFPRVRTYPEQKKTFKAIFEDYQEFMDGYDKDNCQLLFSRKSNAAYQKFLEKRYKDLYLARSGLTSRQISKKELTEKALDLMSRTDKGLIIKTPDKKPCDYAYVFKIERYHHPKID